MVDSVIPEPIKYSWESCLLAAVLFVQFYLKQFYRLYFVPLGMFYSDPKYCVLYTILGSSEWFGYSTGLYIRRVYNVYVTILRYTQLLVKNTHYKSCVGRGKNADLV